MKRKITWLDRLMAAITFAEANDHETARMILASGKRTEKTGEQAILKPLSSEA